MNYSPSLFLFIVIVKCDCSVFDQEELLGVKKGHVGNESFVYLYVHHLGSIIISLTTDYGDADIYISDKTMLPTYEADSYDLHSATCGRDVIAVPENFRSPVSVGIYGHPAYEVSSFVLEVYKKSSAEYPGSLLVIDDEMPKHEDQEKRATENANTRKVIKAKKKVEKVTNKIGGIFSLFEIFQLIFL